MAEDFTQRDAMISLTSLLNRIERALKSAEAKT
jgi:hypothetical protein